MIELLIAMLAGSVALFATMESFQHFQQRFLGQHTRMAQHQDLRVGLAVLGSELRLAGPGGSLAGSPLLKAEPKEIAFRANLGGYTTTLTADVSANGRELAVHNGSGWPKRKRVVVCERDRCAEGRLNLNGRKSVLTLIGPLGQAFPAGSEVVVVNEVRYYLGPGRPGYLRLMREVDGRASALVDDVAEFELAYVGKDGTPTSEAARVARVLITLAVGESRRTIRNEVGLRV